MIVIEERTDGSVRVALRCKEPSRVRPEFKDDADINVLVDRAMRTGHLEERAVPPVFGDFTNVPSWEEANLFIADARQRFMELPADVRKRFNNDAGQLVAAWTAVNNGSAPEHLVDELVQLGLWEKPPADPPPAAPPPADPPPAPPAE